jgi:hypothetical protein
MKVSPKLFSLEEANSMLPELETRLSRLLEKKEDYARRHDELLMHELIIDAERHGGLSQETADLEEEIRTLETAIADLEKDIHAIHELGCIVRNVEKGWVDFLGRWRGELIYFCWRRGEMSIQFYHPLHDSIQRRSLAEEDPPSR